MPVDNPLLSPGLADVPAPPRRPSRRARKLIFRYTGSQSILRLAGAIFLIVGLAFSIPLLWGLPSDIVISISKREIPGRLLRLGKASYSANGETPTRLFYEYTVNGKDYQASSDVFSSSNVDLDGLQSGQNAIPVQVSRLLPSYARVTGTRNALVGPFGLLGLLFPLLGGTLLFFAIRGNRREIRAFVHGEPVLAKVVSLGEDRSTSINGRHPIRLCWEFRARDGEVYDGSLSSMQYLEFEHLQGADQVVVLYDPQHPQANTLYIA